MLFGGLTVEKLLVLGVVAVFLLGPERLPSYAAKLAQLVKSLRAMANGAKDRMRDEMGPDFDEVDWKKLDPRQYDPRRIIREALLDDDEQPSQVITASKPVTVQTVAGQSAGASIRRAASAAGATTPFDSEAT